MIASQTFYIFSAVILFFAVNWIGRGSTDLGYQPVSLFEEPTGAVLTNFAIRVMSPVVFVILLSTILYGYDYDKAAVSTYCVVIYYYVIRFLYICLWDKWRLVSWPRFVSQALIAGALAYLAYKKLIIPRDPLFPDVKTLGNELWLALIAFIYAVGNNFTINTAPSSRRKNRYIEVKFLDAREKYGPAIQAASPNRTLELTINGILLLENYNRPPFLRLIEQLYPKSKTTGIMQIGGARGLDDHTIVKLASAKIVSDWEDLQRTGEYPLHWQVIEKVISRHNRDQPYIDNVLSVMEILAKRSDRSFEQAYDVMFPYLNH